MPCSLKTLINKFGEEVELEYSRQNTSSETPTWSQIQPLLSTLKMFKGTSISGEMQQTIFINHLRQYIELVMGFLSSYEETEYRTQIRYSSICLTDIIPVIVSEGSFQNRFIEEASNQVFDLFLCGNFNLLSKRGLINVYNQIASESLRDLRIKVAGTVLYYMYKFLDFLPTHGDYGLQSDVMETLFRIFGNRIRDNENIGSALLPGSEDLGKALTTDISTSQFDADVRKWLNKFNEDSPYIFSIGCKKVMFGSQVCPTPKELDKVWVDFDLKQNTMGFWALVDSSDSWNRVIILAKDIKKTEVLRPIGANECVVSFHMSKPPISSDCAIQDEFDKLEKHFKIIISSKEKDKITKLRSTVLPQLFGDTFLHTSAKISSNHRNVYKPLPIKISKKKSGTSDISVGTSVSKSKSEAVSAASTVEMKISTLIPEQTVTVCSDNQENESNKTGTNLVMDVRHSKMQKDITVPDVSIGNTVTDFTRLSNITCTLDDSSVFTSRPASPDEPIDGQQKDQPKVQDNIVTSSHDEDTSTKIEILSGRCSGKSVDYHKDIGFHPSEVFSSSPVKISQLKNSDDIFSDSSLSEDAEQQDISQKKKDSKPIVSTTVSQEEMLDEQFETAVENIENEYIEMEKRSARENKSFHIRDLNEKQKILTNKLKVSKSTGQITDSELTKKNWEDLNTFDADVMDAQNKAEVNKEIDTRLSRLKTRAEIIIECERIQDLQIEDNADSNTNIPDKELGALQSAHTQQLNEALKVNSESLSPATEKEDINNINTESTPSNIITALGKNKNIVSDLYNENALPIIKDLRVILIKDDINKRNNDIHSEETIPERDSEDVFARPTQVVTLPEEEFTEEFTDLSLAVNVGISADQFSENVRRFETKFFKPDIKVTKKQSDLNMKENKDNRKTHGDDKEGSLYSKRTLIEENKENIVDLTTSDNDEEESSVVKAKEKHMKNKQTEEKKKLKKVIPENKPLLNTPELLNILDEVNPLDKSLQGLKTTEKTTDAKRQMNTDRGNDVVKNSIVTKEKPKTRRKKPRTLIKTGKKRFDLEDLAETQNIQDNMDKNEKVLHEKRDKVFVSDEGKIQEADASDIKSNLQESVHTRSKKGEVSDLNKEKIRKASDLGGTLANKKQTKNKKYGMHVFNKKIIQQASPLQPQVQNKSTDHQVPISCEEKMQEVDDIEDTSQLKAQSQSKEHQIKSFDGNKVQEVHDLENTPQNEAQNRNEEPQEEKIDKRGVRQDTLPDHEQSCYEEHEVNLFDKEKTQKASGTQKKSSLEDTSIEQNVEENLEEPQEEKIDKRGVRQDTLPDHEQSCYEEHEVNLFDKEKTQKASCTQKESSLDDTSIEQNVEENLVEQLKKKEGEIIDQASQEHVKNDLEKENIQAPEPVTLSGSEDNAKVSNIVKKGKKSKGKRKPKLAKRKVIKSSDDEPICSTPDPSKHVMPTKSPDTSPDGMLCSERINTSAEVHWSEENPINTITDKVNDSKLLNEELQKIEEDARRSCRNKGEKKKKRKIIDFDEISVVRSPIFKRTRSKEQAKSLSPDDFDKVAEMTNNNTFNKSKMNTTAGNRTRRLYIPGNLSHLDEMPDITEQVTPELNETPIAVVKGKKLTKQKRNQLIKEKQESAKKMNTIAEKTIIKSVEKKTNRKTVKTEKKEKATNETFKPKRRSGKKKEFTFDRTDFVTLEKLFNTTCRNLGNADDTFTDGIIHQPIDIAVRSAPQYSSSEESPPVRKSTRMKNTSPELPKSVRGSRTPPTSDYSFPDLEIEPVLKKHDIPYEKINILQNIVQIQPAKRPLQDLISNEPTKRRKLEEKEVAEDILVPNIPEDDNVKLAHTHVTNDVPNVSSEVDKNNEDITEPEDAAVSEDIGEFFELIITIGERIQNSPRYLQKLRELKRKMDRQNVFQY